MTKLPIVFLVPVMSYFTCEISDLWLPWSALKIFFPWSSPLKAMIIYMHMYICICIYNSKCTSNLKMKRNKIKVQYKRKANENKTPNLPGMDCSTLGLHVLTSKVWHRPQTAEGHHLPQTALHKIKQHTIKSDLECSVNNCASCYTSQLRCIMLSLCKGF